MPLGRLIWPRRTERLLLRRFTVDDADALCAYRSLPEVAQWTSRRIASADEIRADAETWASRNLVVEADGVVVGDAMVKVEDGWAQAEVADRVTACQAELGWTFAPQAWGRGYGTELVAELLAIAFDGLGLRRVTAFCFVENVGSWRIMEKLGMRKEMHTVAESLHRDGTWRDGLGYALLAEEYHARAR